MAITVSSSTYTVYDAIAIFNMYCTLYNKYLLSLREDGRANYNRTHFIMMQWHCMACTLYILVHVRSRTKCKTKREKKVR